MRANAIAVLILRDARTPFRLCGSACACALLRMRTSLAFRPSHDVKQPISFPRRVFAPGVCNFASLTRTEGWAERRETFGCSAEHPWGVPSCVKDARERAYDAGRSPLGTPPWRFWASGPRFRLLRRPPSYNGGHLPSGPCSELLAGGRLPGPPGASGYKPPAAGRHSPLRLQDVSGRRPSMSEDGNVCSMASI